METRQTLQSSPAHKTAPVVGRLDLHEHEAAASLLAASFVHERFWAWVFEGVAAEDMARAMEPWFRVWLRSFAHGGQLHAARHEGLLVGVGIRMAPGDYPLTGLPQVGFTLGLARALLRMGWTSPRALRMPGAAAEIEAREPHEPFWHLAWVGVDPDHQGLGVGSALADEAIQCIDQQPAPAWLLTFGEQTRALYERRGFTVREEFRPLADGPAGWSMRRDLA